ncbi:MAG: hypothetical protein Q4D62_15010 [Planctomycetia bacterium]|nr:hypothetical protein [Planctomycetia bacterium]
MFENVGIVCFASCYALAWVLGRWKGAERLALGAGIFAHTAYLYYRTLFYERLPLSSQQDWFLVTAWVMACLALGLVSSRKLPRSGFFLLPLILGVIAVASLADKESYAFQPASAIWGGIHGLSMLLATVAIFCGFLSGMFYLWKAGSLKKPLRRVEYSALPSLEWLHAANRHAMKLATTMLGLGVLSGIVLLQFAKLQGEAVPFWQDAMILGTVLLLVWFLFSLFLGHFWKRWQEGHQVAYRTIGSFVALCVLLGLSQVTEHRHNQAQHPQERYGEARPFSEGSQPDDSAGGTP